MASTEEDIYDFRIIVGTYERLLYGLNVRRIADPALDSVDRFTVKPVFIYPAHITCIKAAATSSRFLATGSTDEHVKVYDLRQRKEVGTLMHHSGSITCLKFYQRTHLMTGSEDGNIAIVRTRDWEVLKTLPAHKRSVNWMDVHPSGKVLLSVGGDGALKCWDMARGACAYSMKLPKPAERVCWSPTGTHYAVLMNDIVQVHAIEDGSLVCTIKQKGRINTIAYAKLNGVEAFNDAPEAIITGSEDRNIGVWSTSGKPLLRWASGHNNRIKDLDIFSYNKKSSVLVTCSSDGGIKVWDLNDVQKQLASQPAPETSPDPSKPYAKIVFPSAAPQAEYNAGCRLTCLTIAGQADTRLRKPSHESIGQAGDAEDSPAEVDFSEAESEHDDRRRPVVSVAYDGEDEEEQVEEEKVKKSVVAESASKKRKSFGGSKGPNKKQRGSQVVKRRPKA